MKFEEVLKLMREGKKVRRPRFEADEYYIGCLQGINPRFFGKDEGDSDFPKSFSIVRMKREFAHPNNRDKDVYWYDKNISSMPDFIFIDDVVADDWEVIEC